MKKCKRMFRVISILATMLVAVTFLFACNGENAAIKNATPNVVEDSSLSETPAPASEGNVTIVEESSTEESRGTSTDTTEKNTDISEQNKQTTEDNKQTSGESEEPPSDLTEPGGEEGERESEEGNGEVDDHDDTIDESDIDESNPQGDELTRIRWITADGEWDVCVHDRVVAQAYFDDNAILVIPDFREDRMEVWGKTNEYGHLVCYLYIQAFSGYREIAIREELGVIQIDLTTAELEALLPTPPLEEESDIDELIEESFGEESDENAGEDGKDATDPTEEIVGGEESQEYQEDDPSDELGEEEENKPADETGDPDQDPPADDDPIENDPTEDDPEQKPITDENGEQGGGDPREEETGDPLPNDPEEKGEDPQADDPQEDPVIDPQEGGDPIEDPEDPSLPEEPKEEDPTDPEPKEDSTPDPDEDPSLCPICGAPLSDTSAHFVLCEHYVILPMESEAYDLLSALPGMKEDIVIAALDEENEIYSFVLNYLTYEEAAEIREAITGVRYYSDAAIHTQKVIGSKVFTFDVNFCDDGDLCKATIYLRGYAVE